MQHRFLIATLLICLFSMQIAAAETVWRSRPLSAYIQELAEQGLQVIYSDSLVTADMQIANKPRGNDPIESLRIALQPHGLMLVAGPGENWLVVRDPDAERYAAVSDSVERPVLAEALPEVIVSSSRYSIRYQQSGSHTFLDRDFASNLPDVGEDAIRSIDRMPGVASGGVSTRTHVRGGVANEQLIILDGLRLYEPYHLKDFHSIASIINQSAIDGIDFYTAGYQARYGDRMSGVMDIGLRSKPATMQTELGISLFNMSALSTGTFGPDLRGDWLVSARRSNLDIISRAIKKDYGSPEFEDVLAHAGWQWTDRNYIAANFLYSHDSLSLSRADGSEKATAKYRNNVGWIKIETDWSDAVSITTLLSATDIGNDRNGSTDIPDTVTGSVIDSRDFSSFGVKQDWMITASDNWTFRAGLELNLLDAEYDYDSSLLIAPPFDQILQNQPFLQRSISTVAEGEQYAAYVEARWRIKNNLFLDLGFRFDRQTYSVADTNEQKSPRLNVLYQPHKRIELRMGAGRFYQAQEINELQINDGLEEFFPPQYSDHLVASALYHFDSDIDLRFEAYQKSYKSLMPRFENVFNALVLLPELQIDRIRIDADESRVQGAELTVSGGVDKVSARWWFGYVWSSAEDSFGKEEIRRSWDQTHAVKFGANTDLGHWNISIAGTWHSGWPKTTLLVESVQSPAGDTTLLATTTPRNSLNYGPFHTLDVRASRTFQLSNSELIGFLEISNAYNRVNPCCTEYSISADGAGEAALATEAEHWLPLVPSIGVLWKF
jgi:outer membrane receptor protein involved in Fe transport